MTAVFQATPIDSLPDLMFDFQSPAFTLPNVPQHLRCRYTSKPCGNIRTSKRGGGLHRFCEYHRGRANENQWRVDHRRRLQRLRNGGTRRSKRAQSPSSKRQPGELPLLKPNVIISPVKWHDEQADQESSGLQMTTEELCILEYLLFSDHEENAFLFP